MRKLATFLVAAALLIAMAACGGSGGSGSGSSGPVAVDSSGRYVETVRVTQTRILAGWMGFDPGEDEDNNWWTRTYKDQLNVELVNLFTAPNWGPDYDTKINIALATGDLPDVMSLYTTLAVKAIEGNRLMDLTDVYNQYASSQVKEIYAREPQALKAWSMNGKMYGIAGTADSPSWQYFWVPKSALDEFNGGVLPTTLAQVEQLASQIVAKNGGYGFGMSNNLGSMLALYDLSHATEVWIMQNGQLEWGKIQPEIRNSWTKLADWYQRGLLARDFASKSDDDVEADFLNNRCAIIIDGTNMPNSSKGRNWILLNPNDDLVAIPVMAADGRDITATRSAGYGEAIMISSTCKNPDAVMRLFNLSTAISNDFGKPSFIRDATYDWTPNGNMGFWNRMCTGNGWVADRIPENQPGYQAVLEITSGGDGSRLANMNAFSALEGFRQMSSWISEGTSGDNWDLNWSVWNMNIGTNTIGHSARMLQEGKFASSPRTGQEVEAEAANNQNLYAKYIEIATLAVMNNTVDRSFAEWVDYYYANGGQDIYAQVREQFRNQ